MDLYLMLPILKTFGMMKILLPTAESIGLPTVLLPQLKTRVVADHAGLSQVLLLWKALISLPQELSILLQNSNLLIAALPITVVMEDGPTKPSSTMSPSTLS